MPTTALGEVITILEQPQFGQRVRELRIAHGLSQSALAEPGMSTSYLSRLESGARKPTSKVAAYLAEQLGVDSAVFDSSTSTVLMQVLARGMSTIDWQDSDEIYGLLTDIVKTGTDVDPALRWQVMWLLADVHSYRDDRAAELASLTSLVQLADTLGVPELQVRSRFRLSRLSRMTGSPETASVLATEALELARDGAVPVFDRCRALMTAISSAAETGQLAVAARHVDELCAVVKEHPGIAPTLIAEARWAAASVRMRQGENEAACGLLELAMRDLDSRDDILLWTRLRLAAASIYLQMSPRRTDLAAARLAEADVPIRLVGSRANQQEYCFVEAQVAYHEGRFEDAERLCAALSTEQSLLAFRDQVRLDMLRMRLQFKSGSLAGAVEEITALATRLQNSNNSDLSAEAWHILSEALTDAAGSKTRSEEKSS